MNKKFQSQIGHLMLKIFICIVVFSNNELESMNQSESTFNSRYLSSNLETVSKKSIS